MTGAPVKTAEVKRMVDLQKVFSIRTMCSSLAGSLMDTEGWHTADGSNWHMEGFYAGLMSSPGCQSDITAKS